MSLRDRLRRGARTPGDGHQRVVLAESLDIAAPAERVMAFLTDVGNAPLVENLAAGVGVVTVPGTPVGQVGERQVLLVPWPLGLVTTVRDVIELVPGRRIVTRTLAPSGLVSTFEAEPMGPGRCRLSHRRSVELTGSYAALLRVGAPERMRWTLASIAHHTAGASAVGAPPAAVDVAHRDARAAALRDVHARTGATRTTMRAAVDVAAAPARVWEIVVDPGSDCLGLDDPQAVSFRLPGTPVAAVGERRCVVHRVAERHVIADLTETIAIDPGRSLVLRHVTLNIHSPVTTLVLEPTETGTRLTSELEVDDHGYAEDGAARARDLVVAHLAAIRGAAESG